MAYISQEDKKELAPAIKAVLKKYKMKGTISIRDHRTLVVTIKSGALPFEEDYAQVNHYYIQNHYEGKCRKFLEELKDAMYGDKWYDNSDAQVDYFDTAYYISINLGKWNKPYERTPHYSTRARQAA